jgi:thioesterase domain-containing protein
MGALLALEIANQLQDAGEEVSHLVIFNTDASWMNVSGLGDQLEYHLREMGETGVAGGLRYIWWRTRFRLYRAYSTAIWRLRRLYAWAGKSFPARLRYVYIAELNYRAGWDFRPRPFQGTISYFQGEVDQRRDPRPYWGKLVTQGIEIHPVTGEMAGVFEPPHVEALAEALGASLERPARASS